MNYVDHDPPLVTHRTVDLSISVGAVPLVERIERQAARIVFLESVVETLQSMLREQDAGKSAAAPPALRHGEPLRNRPRDMPYLPSLKDGEPLDYQLGVGIADTSSDAAAPNSTATHGAVDNIGDIEATLARIAGTRNGDNSLATKLTVQSLESRLENLRDELYEVSDRHRAANSRRI